MDLVGEVGYEGLTIDEVARRAGVHKTTVYRRWPTRAELVFDAAADMSRERVPVPDTGSLAADLRAFARSVAGNLAEGPAAERSRALVMAAATSAELEPMMTRYWSERFELARVMVQRAVERGEVATERVADIDLVIETLIGPLWVRLLLSRRPIDAAAADTVADLVAAGLGLALEQPMT